MKYFILFTTIGLLFSNSSFAASASADNMTIIQIQHNRDDARGVNGRAYIYVDTNYPLPGGCLYSGNTTPAIEIDTTHGSYKGMLSLAMTSYASGKKIYAAYDDGFGSGTTCRLLSLKVHN